MNLYFLIMEFGAIFSFIAILYRERKDPKMAEALPLAFAYGIILEALNIYMSHTYEYGNGFLLRIANVPLAIGAGWAVIYYLAGKSAEKFRLAWWQAPFLMALIALSYDLAIDAVAIRLGFWSWKIPMDEEWFGVPYDNFFGWLAVVWTFAFAINLSFQKSISPLMQKAVRYSAPVTSSLLLGMQIMIYINLSAILSGAFSWSEANRLYWQGEYAYAYIPQVQEAKLALLAIIVLALFSLCSLWIKRRKTESEKDKNYFSFQLSSSIHLVFIAFMLFSGIYANLPILLPISLGAFSSNLFLELSANPKK